MPIDPKIQEQLPFQEGPDPECQLCDGTGSYLDFHSKYNRLNDEFQEEPFEAPCDCEWARHEQHQKLLQETQHQVESILLGENDEV